MEIINPTIWARPKGYSNGIKASAGRLVLIAGQIAWDERQRMVGRGHFAIQFDQALANVLTVLREAGGQAEHLVKLTIFVTDKEAYRRQQQEIGQAYRRRMGKHYPAMSLVEVKSLLEDDALVEIEAMAVIESIP
jgi:enamine deaminase RidA (YjgF/YER057c/UK114 family)